MDHSTQDTSVLDTAAATAASLGAELALTLQSAKELARAAGRLADQSARERPWQIALVAAGAGFLVGFWARGR